MSVGNGLLLYRGLDRRIWILAAARAVNTIGLSLVMAFMAVYLVTDRGEAGTLFGSIYLFANLSQSLSQGAAGELSDRVGRVRLMVTALALRSVVIVGIGVVILTSGSIAALAALLIVSSTLRGGFEPVAYAVVADIAPPGQRVAAYGLQRMGVNLGWALGPALGGALARVIPFGAVFFVAAPTLLLAAIAVSRLSEPERKRPLDAAQPAQRVRRERGAQLFLVCAFLFAVCHVQLFSTLSMYSTGQLGLDKGDVGLVFTANGVAVLLLQIPAIAFINRRGVHAALIIGSILYVGGFLAFGAAAGVAGLVGGVLIFTLGEVVLAPAQQTLNARLGDRGRMGRAFGIFGLVQMLGVAVAPLIGGSAFDALGDRGGEMWMALAALPAIMTVGHLVFSIVHRRSERADLD